MERSVGALILSHAGPRASGGQNEFSLVLTIPSEEVRRYSLDEEQGADVTFEMLFGIRTLGDLVGLTQIMRIAGYAEL